MKLKFHIFKNFSLKFKTEVPKFSQGSLHLFKVFIQFETIFFSQTLLNKTLTTRNVKLKLR